MNNGFKVSSENTLRYIYFHDCPCLKISFLDNALIFDMACLEVLPEHPDNPNKQAHHSGPGKVLLQAPVLVKCEVCKIFGEKIAIDSLAESDFCDFRFLEFEERKEEKGFSAKIFLTFDRPRKYDVAWMEIQYEKSYVMWNELQEVSWFEQDRGNNSFLHKERFS